MNEEHVAATDAPAPAATDAAAATDDRTLPATRTDSRLVTAERQPRTEWRQPVSVAYLPLALVAFTILAFVMAVWTFLAATG